MKKIALFILILGALILGSWLVLRQSKSKMPAPIVPPPIPAPKTNAQTSTQPPVQLSSAPAPLFPVPGTNIPVRPTAVDNETWNRWLAYRQMILNANQPVEFYARVLDQNGQPVEGAKLTLKLGRMEGMAFMTTNFSAWNPAKATHTILFYKFSDSNGWIRVSGTNGSYIEMCGLSKEGYASSYPNGNFGGVHYEANGVRTPMINIETTNAWNPQKGVILHMRKIEETNGMNH